MADGEHTPRHRFGKVRTDALDPDELRTSIRRALEQGTPLFITYANAHNVCVAERDGAYRSALAAFDVVFPEGVGLARAARKLQYRGHTKFHTTDFWPSLFPLFQDAGAGVFLLGATPETLIATRQRLRGFGLSIAGTADGYRDADNADQTVRAINESGARVLLTGMGVPRQEIWLAEQRERLQPTVVICVGNYFEFVSGKVRRAPRFMRRIGLEWLHRLIVEPGRLWRRYILGIPEFWKIIGRQRRGGGE